MAAEKGKSKVSEEYIEKKLTSFSNTQDSVQALSIMIIHHKSHCRKIVDVWLKVLKKSPTKHKLSLFNLCNDVVQCAKRKKIIVYVEAFRDVLNEATTAITESSIKPNVERIFKIWEERRIYESKFIASLKAAIKTAGIYQSSPATPQKSPAPAKKEVVADFEKESADLDEEAAAESNRNGNAVGTADSTKAVDNSKILAEFKPSKLIETITLFKRLESDVELKGQQLSLLRIDATDLEAIKKLKDRSHGKEFCKQFEDSCQKLEEYVGFVEREMRIRKFVTDMCEKSEIFYEEQYKEAKIVANAYKNFGARINNLKKKLDEMKVKLPEAPSPIPSPSSDAPSPGNTPPLEGMDNSESVDMEISDEENHVTEKAEVFGSSQRRKGAYTATVKSIPQLIPSVTEITMRGQGKPDPEYVPGPVAAPVPEPEPVIVIPDNEEEPEIVDLVEDKPADNSRPSNVLESRIAQMMPTLALGNSNINTSEPVTVPSSFAVPAETVGGYIPPKVVRAAPEYQPPTNTHPFSETSNVHSFGEQSNSQPYKEAGNSQPYKETSNSQSFKEEAERGSSTPVQDEMDEDTPPHKERSQSPPVSKASAAPPKTTKSNPIDFLSSLLTKTQNSSSSSNFLHSLSLLTNTVKNQYEQQKIQQTLTEGSEEGTVTSDASAHPSNWAAWKAANQPPPGPQLPPQPAQTEPPSPSPPIQIPTAQPPPMPPMGLPPPLQGLPNPMQPPMNMPPFSLGALLSQPPPLTLQSPPSPNLMVPPPPPNPAMISPPVSHGNALSFNPMANQLIPPSHGGFLPPGLPRPPQALPPKQPLPWEQHISQRPQSVEPEEEEEEETEPYNLPPPKPLPAPPKGILRKRTSSLKEVQLVDETLAAENTPPTKPHPTLAPPANPHPPSTPPTSTEKKPPAGGNLRKLSDTDKSEEGPPDPQREFIEKLKRKSSASNSNLVVPPVVEEENPIASRTQAVFKQNSYRPNLTTIMPEPSFNDNCSVEMSDVNDNLENNTVNSQEPVGEPISTLGSAETSNRIGVLGSDSDTTINRIESVHRPHRDGTDRRGHGGSWNHHHGRKDFHHDSHYEPHPRPRHFEPRHRHFPPNRFPFFSPYGAPPPPRRPFHEPFRPYYRY